MQAVVIRVYGTSDVLKVEEVDIPHAGASKVLIRVEAVAVNCADIIRRRNDPYPVPTTLPAILGGEVAGFVEHVGEGVTNFRKGDRVFALLGGGGKGGYAQFAVADAAQVIGLPPELEFDIACTLVVAGVTAYQTLREAGRLSPGDSVFIPGAAGGVGSYAIQIAKRLGAGIVIGGASTAEKRNEVVRRGADHAVDYTLDDWPEEIKRLTNGKGADIVLDMAGGRGFDQSLAALAPFGRLVVYGTASRERSGMVPQVLIGKNQIIAGYYVGQWFAAQRERSLEAFRALVQMILEGQVNVAIAGRLPLSGAVQAHQLMETRQATGKFVLKPWLKP